MKSNLIREKGFAVEQTSSLLGSKLFILKFLLSEVLDFKWYSTGYSLINPNSSYEDLKKDSSLTFITDSDYGAYSITYNRSSTWSTKFSINSAEGNVNFSLLK